MAKKKPQLNPLIFSDLFFLSMFSFVSIASSTLAINKKPEHTKVTFPKTSEVLAATDTYSDLPSIPILSAHSSFPIFSAQSVLAVDIDSGVILYEKSPDLALLPASTTKIITALVAMDFYPLDMPLTVGLLQIDGQKMSLVPGEVITVENLLYGLLVYSANDAAEALALNYPGGREAFVAAMNHKANMLSMSNTHFVNPTGLENTGHVSTARDMVRATQAALKVPLFLKMVSTPTKTVTNVEGTIVHRLKNINELLGKVEGVKGVKTGWTENARENLVSYVDRKGKRIVITLLSSQDRFGESEELIEWLYKEYHWEPIAPYFNEITNLTSQ